MVQSEIMKQAVYLSRLIVESDEYQSLVKAQEAVIGDQTAYQIMMGYQKIMTDANYKMMQGMNLSPEEMQVITEQESRINANETLYQWSQYQNIFSKMMEDVLQIIQKGLRNESVSDNREYSASDNPKHIAIYPQ